MTNRQSVFDFCVLRRRLLLASTAAVAALGSPVLAQSPAPAARTAAVEEVVVTAQRREERLQDVPAAISAFSGNQLEKLGISSSKELTQITPGLNFTQSVYSPQPTIRGIGVRGVGAGDESVVPVYVDGVYQSFLASTVLEFNNVERIEVLKGPQGALLGRNATGGAINIITRTPTAQPQAKLSVSYGRYNEWVGKAYLSGGTDLVAASLAVVGSRSKGYIDNPFLGRKLGGNENISARAKVAYRPTDKIDLTFAGSYVNNVGSDGMVYYHPEGNTLAARIPGTPIATKPYTSFVTFVPTAKLRQFTYSVTGVYRADMFTLTSLTAVQGNKLRVQSDSDGARPDLVDTQFVQMSRNLYHETYAVSTIEGPFSWILGGVFFHDVSGMRDPGGDTSSRAVSTAGVVGALSVSRTIPTIRTNSYAAYAQGTLQVTDAWSVTMAGRYTTEKKTLNTSAGRVIPAPATVAPLPQRSKTFHAFTPSVVVQYKPSERFNIYAKAGQAFKSGIFNSSASTVAQTNPLNPEDVIQMEVGFKADPTPWLRVNAAAYHTDYSNLQSSVRRDNASFTENAGKVDIDGIDADAFIRANENLNIRLGLSLIKAKYVDFPAATVVVPALNAAGQPIGGNNTISIDAAGKKLVRTPFTTFNVGADYTVPMATGDVTLSGNVYYQGKSYWEVGNRVVEPSRVMVNGQIRWQDPGEKFGVAIWGENLANEKYNVTRSVSASGDQAMLGRPRTYGVELTYDW